MKKQHKYQHYHQAKLIKINILQVKKYCLLIRTKLKFTYVLLGKAFKKQKKTKTIEDQEENQAKVLESSDIFNKINELKQVKDIFPDDKLNNLIAYRLKKLLILFQ